MKGIPQAIAASPALKAYFVNLMSQPGETTNFRASDHVAALLRHCGRVRGKFIDVVRGQYSAVFGAVPWNAIAPGRAAGRDRPG